MCNNLIKVISLCSTKELLAIKRAISLNETFVLFCKITTGETRHIQKIYIDEPSMHHCPHFVYLKRDFLNACNNYFLLNDNLFRSSTVLVIQ